MSKANELKFLNVPVVISNLFYSEKFHPKITGLKFIVGPLPIIKLWKKIMPHAKKVVILGGVNNDFSVYLINQFEKQAKKSGYEILKIYRIKYAYEWKEAILEINKSKADFILGGLWLDIKMRNGKTQTPEEYDNMRYWICRNTNKGVCTFINSTVVRGLTIGLCSDDEFSIGDEIADIMIKILSGKKVEEIPVKVPRSLYISVNIKHAKKIGLKIPYEILNEARFIYDKFVGEYDDNFFKKHTGGAVQPKKSAYWDWIPK